VADTPDRAVPAQAWTVAGTTVYMPLLDPAAGSGVVANLVDAYQPKTPLLVTAPDVTEALISAGGTRGRHVYLMRHDLQDVPPEPTIAGLTLRGWEPADARRLAPSYIAAYGEGHPDQRGPDLELAAESLNHTSDDPDNPLMTSISQVAVVSGEPIGVAMVTLSEQMTNWSGPWLMNTFRSPDIAIRRIGAAMIVRTMHLLKQSGYTYYGLMVTTKNPAYNVYTSLGFKVGLEGTMVVLPE